jgi:hypothetical protein
LGSVLIQIILQKTLGTDNNAIPWNQRAKTLAHVLIGFSFVMALGFPIASICIPNVQERVTDDDPEAKGKRRLVSKKLEKLAPGILAAELDGQLIGGRWFEEHWPKYLTWKRRTRRIEE